MAHETCSTDGDRRELRMKNGEPVRRTDDEEEGQEESECHA